jgi:hypothetical protein
MPRPQIVIENPILSTPFVEPQWLRIRDDLPMASQGRRTLRQGPLSA